MFKKLFMLFAGLYSFAFSQSNFPTPLKFDSRLTAGSTMLQQNLQIFLPDTVSQILFNPSRANNYNGSFVYANYLPEFHLRVEDSYIPFDETPNHYPLSFSSAALINCENHKWLLSFNVMKYNRNYEDGNTYNDFATSQTIKTVNYKTNENSFIGKISFINSGILGNYSIGLFFKTSSVKNRDDRYEFNRYSNHYIYNNNTYGYQTTNIGISNQYNELNKINLGLEVSLNGNNSDYIGRLSYQFNDNIKQWGHIMHYLNYDTTNGVAAKRFFDSDELSKLSGSPYTVSFENFYTRKLSLLSPSDYLFASVDVFVGNGTMTDQYYYNFIGSDTTFKKGNNVMQDSKLDGADVSLGYVIKKDLSDIHLITGINFNGSYYTLKQQSNYYENYPYASDLTYKNYSTWINLPIYANYSPAEWVSLMGGLNINYIQNYNKVDRESKSQVKIGETYPVESSLTKQDNGSINTQNFFGLELRHPSGLQVQISFNRTLSETAFWNLSMGYHF